MSIRERIKNNVHTGYRYAYTGTPVVSRNESMSLSTCVDDDASGDNHPLTITSYEKYGGLLTGKSPSTSILRKDFSEYPGGWSGYWTGHVNVTSQTDAIYATTLLKRTNPSRASIDGMVAAVEMRELPSTLRDLWGFRLSALSRYVGRSQWRFLKKAAKANLLVQFGIMPLLSDLDKLLIFQKYVSQRIKEIERLRTRGLRRTVDLDTLTATSPEEQFTFFSNDASVNIRRWKVTTVKVRGHVRYTTTSKVSDFTTAQLRREALDIVIGNRFDPYTLYELMPWSWLIDYFANLGDFVHTSRNALNTSHSTPRIMIHRRTVVSSRVTSKTSWITCDPPTSIVETKVRRLAPAIIDARLPFLNGRQLSILGSLAISKARA